LLFMDDKSAAKLGQGVMDGSECPSKSQLLSLPYISHLRPSTLMGYLISCAPVQLPSPFDAASNTVTGDKSNLFGYVDMLVSLSEECLAKDSKTLLLPSVRGLYHSSWKRSKSEQEAWMLVQAALDTFLQRISVMTGPQKAIMRKWYELILELGGHFFDK
jgi:hypothetical protein